MWESDRWLDLRPVIISYQKDLLGFLICIPFEHKFWWTLFRVQLSTFRWLNDREGVDPGSCNWHMILVMGQPVGWDCWGSRACKCSWMHWQKALEGYLQVHCLIGWCAHAWHTLTLQGQSSMTGCRGLPSQHQQSIYTHQPWSPRSTILCSICKLLLPHCETNSPLLSLKAATTSGEPLSMDVHLQGNFTLPHLGWHTN